MVREPGGTAFWTTARAGARYMLLASAPTATKISAICQVGAQIRPATAGRLTVKAITGIQAYQRRSRWLSLSAIQPATKVPMTPVDAQHHAVVVRDLLRGSCP